VVSRQLLDSLTARLVFLSFRVSKRMRCLLRPLAIALNEVRVTMLQHPFITGPLAEQRRAALRGQADHIRQLRTRGPSDRPGRRYTARWWRPAARPGGA
jgi:hypothetical protein